MSVFSPSVASSSGCSSFTINSFTQNLASVLSDTRRSKAEVAAFFTRHWGEQFVPRQTLPRAPTIPAISLQHFRHYLDNAAKKHRHYLRAKKALQRANVQLFGEQISKDQIPEIFFSPSFSHRDPHTFEAVFLEPRPGEPDKLLAEAEKRNGGVLRRPESCGSLSSLQSAQSAPVPQPPEDAGQGRLFRACDRLQHRLEYFDDALGALLSQQLEAKGEQFWRILNSYGALHTDLEEAIGRVCEARTRLAKARRELCQRSEHILTLHTARENRLKLQARLHEIACLRDAQTTVQILLSQGDIPRALECIDTAQEVLANNLRGVNCFRHLSNQLDELIIAIGKVLQEEFLSIIQKEFAWPIEERAGEGRQRREEEMQQVISALLRCGEFRFMQRLRSEIEEAAKNTTRQVVKGRLLEFVPDNAAAIGLGPSSLAEQIGQLSDAQWANTLRGVLQSLSVLCRRVFSIQFLVIQSAQQATVLPSVSRPSPKLPSSSSRTQSPVTDEIQFPPSKRRGSMNTTFSAPQPIGLSVPSAHASSIRGTKSECAWMGMEEGGEEDDEGQSGNEGQQTAGSEGGRDQLNSGQSIRAQQQPLGGSVLAMPCHDITQLRAAAPLLTVHVIHTSEERVAKLIAARYKDAILERCRPSVFHEMCKMVEECVQTWHKIAEPEQRALSPPNGAGKAARSPIHTVIQQQTTKFIAKFSEVKRQQFNAVIDSEPWRPVQIPAIFQRIVDRFLLNGTLSDVDDEEEEEKEKGRSAGEVEGEEGDEEQGQDGDGECLVLGVGKRFMVVGTGTLLLRILAQYSDLLALFPHCAMELVMDVVQMLKAFNSRTCQLILGAGARQLVGLRTITVKHMALASRTLQFIAHFIPTLRQSFADTLPPERQTMLRHFDQTQRDYADHVGEIRSKLLGMMDRELIGALEEWKLEGKTPTASFQQIVMQIGKFYSSYSAVMPADATTEILLQIHANFKLYLHQHLQSRGISPHDSILYGMASQDFAYYVENVRALPDCQTFPDDTIGNVLKLQQKT